MQGAQEGCVVLDIGGTLTKFCFVTPNGDSQIPHKQNLTIHLHKYSLYFGYFKIVSECWQFLAQHFSAADEFSSLVVTGGGAYKFDPELRQICAANKMQMTVVQEFESLAEGLNFFKQESEYKEFLVSVFSKETKTILTLPNPFKELKVPLLVVNVGSGVSFLNITENENGELTAKRVGGTSLGGGFFMGLANMLVGQNNFQKLLEMAEKGDVKNTDIIPSDFPELSQQFSEATVLVSLGKLDVHSRKQDIVRSLFFMVTFNLAQLALSYTEIYQVDNVLFTGFYCRENNFFLECFSEAFDYYNKQSTNKRVYSMLHDGFLGALGALSCHLHKK